MVKKINDNIKVQPEEEEIDDINNNEPIQNEINLIDELNKKNETIKEEFKRLYKNKQISWLETLDVTSDTPMDQDLNVEDDIKCELNIYNITKENAIKAIKLLKKENQKINRPNDYFTEMLKSDEQMENIKKQIIKEQQYIKKFEEKKQKLQNIKFSKTLKDIKNKEKSSNKRNMEEGLKQWKKHIKQKPGDYKNIDKFIGEKKKKKFDFKDVKQRYKANKSNKRPGKVRRMIQRNKKNSRKNK